MAVADAIGHISEFNHRTCIPRFHPLSIPETSAWLKVMAGPRGFDLQCAYLPSDNLGMDGFPGGAPSGQGMQTEPFSPGALVIATLLNPREKFWGMVLALAPAGLSLSGVELASFEDLAVMVRDGEPFTPAMVFFPMHRIERVELDLPDGSLPSLSQRFLAKTGLEPAAALSPKQAGQGQNKAEIKSSSSKERA